jgi:prevent-host-death family protein
MDDVLFFQTGFTEAKRHLSDLMTGVVHDHRPVQVNRHGEKEQMFLLARRELEDLLELTGRRFETRVLFDDGEVSVSLPAFSLIGAGETVRTLPWKTSSTCCVSTAHSISGAWTSTARPIVARCCRLSSSLP